MSGRWSPALKMMKEARESPQHMCSSSKYASLMAEMLIKDGKCPDIIMAPENCGETIARALLSLWTVRADAAAKDAEIEQLQDKVDGLRADVDSVVTVLWRHGGQEGRDWVRLNYPDWIAAKHARRAVLRRQDRRSEVSRSQTPDSGSGDTG